MKLELIDDWAAQMWRLWSVRILALLIVLPQALPLMDAELREALPLWLRMTLSTLSLLGIAARLVKQGAAAAGPYGGRQGGWSTVGLLVALLCTALVAIAFLRYGPLAGVLALAYAIVTGALVAIDRRRAIGMEEMGTEFGATFDAMQRERDQLDTIRRRAREYEAGARALQGYPTHWSIGGNHAGQDL